MKWNVIISNKHGIYTSPHELPNDLRQNLRKLKKIRKISKLPQIIPQRPDPPNNTRKTQPAAATIPSQWPNAAKKSHRNEKRPWNEKAQLEKSTGAFSLWLFSVSFRILSWCQLTRIKFCIGEANVGANWFELDFALVKQTYSLSLGVVPGKEPNLKKWVKALQKRPSAPIVAKLESAGTKRFYWNIPRSRVGKTRSFKFWFRTLDLWSWPVSFQK